VYSCFGIAVYLCGVLEAIRPFAVYYFNIPIKIHESELHMGFV